VGSCSSAPRINGGKLGPSLFFPDFKALQGSFASVERESNDGDMQQGYTRNKE
jgi:hypothetical protein